MDPKFNVDTSGTGTMDFDFASRRWRAKLFGWRTPLTPAPVTADGGPAATIPLGMQAARFAQRLVNRYYSRGVAGGRL